MQQKRLIPFHITGIDSLGQGVSKLGEKVTFIPKTTIGDKGEATIISEKKGVIFARASSFTDKSGTRVLPECEHFNNCYSCHFLHMSYEDEIKYKFESFQKLLRKLTIREMEVIKAPNRLGYRNRIQLHYSIKSKLLGMKDPLTGAIIPIPKCKIGLETILQEVDRLFKNNQWLKEIPASSPLEGHLELYWNDQLLRTTWNRPYAEGGFTQVYEEMNQQLKLVLKNQWGISSSDELLDLFGGNGNLSSHLPHSRRLCVDIYRTKTEQDFIHQDLYEPKALQTIKQELESRKMNPNHILLDPPRSGFKELAHWLRVFQPKSLAYVSCDPHTLTRDLEKVEEYHIRKAFLIDFFPSTFHFESLIFLERK